MTSATGGGGLGLRCSVGAWLMSPNGRDISNWGRGAGAEVFCRRMAHVAEWP